MERSESVKLITISSYACRIFQVAIVAGACLFLRPGIAAATENSPKNDSTGAPLFMGTFEIGSPMGGDSSGACTENLDCDDEVPDSKASPVPPAAERDSAPGLAGGPSGRVDVYYFWGKGCRHCEDQSRFLDVIQARHPTVSIHRYEIWHDKGNAALLEKVLALASLKFQGIPVTIMGNRLWVGFNETYAVEMEKKITDCLDTPCVDPLGTRALSIAAQLPAEDGISGPEETPPQTALTMDDRPWVDIPFLGRVDPSGLSLPVFTVIIAGLDGFNPCAFFVLLFLLSMLIHTKSRPRMLLVGGLFVATSGAVYFMFMAAWLNLFLVIGEMQLVTKLAGLFALVLGAVNAKDYFFWKKGVSLSISQENKSKLYAKMRDLLSVNSILSLVIGTMVLALTANMYELLCTAGFPMVFTRVLTLHGLSSAQYYGYLALYNIIYVVPLAVIVLIFSFSMGSRKLTEGEGRALKLISGLMMLAMGGLLLIRPQLLGSPLGAGGLLLGVLALSGAVLLIARIREKNKNKGNGPADRK